MNRKCAICGRDADILCSDCHKFVCENCYEEEYDACIKCAGKRINPHKNNFNASLLRIGLLVLFGGISTTLLALIPMTGTRVIIFPFIFEELNVLSSLLVMLSFIFLFTLPSLLPWIMNKHMTSSWGTDIYTINDSQLDGRNFTEKTKLLITTEITKNLVDTVYFEDDGEILTLLSSKDKSFRKSYSIPVNYSVDTVQYEYEKSYLVLQVNLVKNR